MTADPQASAKARKADRLYGELLILLAIASAVAPLFAEAVLAWGLLLAGAAGVWWMALDRTPRGLLAGAAWTLITLALGLHLTFHILLGALPLELTLGAAFVGLGVAELLLGLERYQPRPLARVLLIGGGVVAILFGLSVPLVWPDIPSWAAGGAAAAMFGTFGVGLLIGAARRRRVSATET